MSVRGSAVPKHPGPDRSVSGMVGRRRPAAASVVALTLLIAACAGDAGPSTTTSMIDDGSVTTSPVTTSAVTTGPAANDLAAFDRTEVALVLGETEVVLTVAVADTPTLRAQGLMGVTDLVGVDGMWFVWGEEIDAGFWMKGTLIPLDIWFFDGAGGYVDSFTMVPCETESCPTYPAAGPFVFALETEVGRLDPAARPRLVEPIPRSG